MIHETPRIYIDSDDFFADLEFSRPGRAGPRTKQNKGLRFEPIFLKCEKWTFPELIPSSFVATRALRGTFSSTRVFGAPCYLSLHA